MPLKHGTRLLIFWLAFLLHAGIAKAQQEPPRTRSPHGPLEIACQNCHASDSWKPIRHAPDFDHNRQTQFPLTGQHTTVGCTGCHVQPVFSNTGQTCASCHADFHRRQFGASCENCHTVKGWRVQIDAVQHHANRFPLVGAHSVATCESCHRGAASSIFTGLATACVSCHSQDYQNARSIDHRSTGFGTACETCHGLTQWRGARFDHSTTRFPLQGAHSLVQCSSCHAGGRFSGTPQTCVGCHAMDYATTTAPNHAAAAFSTECAGCHTTSSWRPTQFDHSKTRFPLTGQHAAAGCTACHGGNRFAGTPQDCALCHGALYDRTTNPNHVAAAFPRDCALCHATSAWRPASFDHSRTRFPLTGAHVSASCASCHSSGQYVGLSTTCVSCHLNKYNATTSPNHVAAAFPQDCALCHTTAQWLGAVFDHNRTRFALTGAHTTVQCASCHIGGRYAGTPTDCYSCHSSEYNTVTNPNHVAAGFPKTCASCHTTTTWVGARFTHQFPIYSGAHAGKWTTCNDCHTNTSNYSVFSCLNCHVHARTTMDEKHRQVSGYVYESLSCYGCHPTGKH